MDLAALAFVGAAGALLAGLVVLAQLFDFRFACLAAGFCFGVQFGGLGGGDASLAQARDVDFKQQFAAGDAQAVINPHQPRGLGTLAVDLDLAALDRLLSQTARLEKPRRPQPLVQSYRFHVEFCQRKDFTTESTEYTEKCNSKKLCELCVLCGSFFQGFDAFEALVDGA